MQQARSLVASFMNVLEDCDTILHPPFIKMHKITNTAKTTTHLFKHR
jgi:hypothetical protein